tara:strand:- start:569 stop:919 length:351 start_codon:yes stop_codon:yes gene_type:complete
MPKPVKIKNVSSSGFMSVNVRNKSIPNLEFPYTLVFYCNNHQVGNKLLDNIKATSIININISGNDDMFDIYNKEVCSTGDEISVKAVKNGKYVGNLQFDEKLTYENFASKNVIIRN